MFMARTVVDGQSQADPQFRTTRLYTRLTAAEVRRQLIIQKSYSDEELPTAETIGTKLNLLGYYPKKVAKSQPQKNSQRADTDNRPRPAARRLAWATPPYNSPFCPSVCCAC